MAQHLLPMPDPNPIIQQNLADEMTKSYVDYAMSVIVSRALPDVRDGLKPAQRRVLYAMHELNLVPTGPTKKCAKICGDTTGNYHPHGEAIVYPTLVRLGQPWSMRYPLVQPKGNFGSQDGDPPAAMRYTEAKFAPPAIDLITDELRQDTVPFVPNYDQSTTEPTVFPAAFPNLLANGSEGIAVGMATKIPPHNIAEVCDALTALIDDPDIAPEHLLNHIKGPDFPTGGIIVGSEGIRQAYLGTGPDRGRGLVRVRAKCEVEERKGKAVICVTELPYQVTRRAVVDKIRELMRTERIKGIADVNDLSDKNNDLLIEIELKKDGNAKVILNQLYKYTPLEDTYGINIIALVPLERDLNDLDPYEFAEYEPTRPSRLNLKELLCHYRDHRYLMIRRRTNFQLHKSRDRAHLVEGRLKALNHIDEIIKLVRAAESPAVAKEQMMAKWGFTDVQAEDILAMALRQLTRMARIDLDTELDKLKKDIARYEQILGSSKEVFKILRREIADIRKNYADDRKTKLVRDEGNDDDETKYIADDEVIVTISHEGYIKRVPLNTYKRQARAGVGVSGGDLKEGDFIEHLFTTSMHQYILLFTNRGKMYSLRVWETPEMARTARGRSLANFVQLDPQERITAAYQVRTFDIGAIVMATKKGVVKKTALNEYASIRASGIIAIKLDEGDELIGVRLSMGEEDIMLGTASGYAIRLPATDREIEDVDPETGAKEKRHVEGVREIGRATRGVRGIKLRSEDDEVVDLIVVTPGVDILTVCENGYGKRTPLDEYRLQSRGGMGVINIKTTDRNGKVVALKDVRDGDEMMLMSAKGELVRFLIDQESVRPMGRNTQGVRLKKLDDDDKIVAVTRIAKDIVAKSGEEGDSTDSTGPEGDTGDGVGDSTTSKPKPSAPKSPDELFDSIMKKADAADEKARRVVDNVKKSQHTDDDE